MLTFVNINGDPVSMNLGAVPKKPRAEKGSYHNGWRVVGIPPGSLEEARRDHEATNRLAKSPKPWDEGNWLMNCKKKPVRAKPYEIPEAASQCKAMAEKAGWLRVEVVEVKKEANK
jgi:hypothetical protein